jgi:hypothetical protein
MCNQHLFRAGRYEAAYDYLLAAYELGEGNRELLMQVEQLASQECQWIEQNAPAASQFSPRARHHRDLLSSFRSIWHMAKLASAIQPAQPTVQQ